MLPAITRDGVFVDLELVRLGLQVAVPGLVLAIFLLNPEIVAGIWDVLGADGPKRPRPGGAAAPRLALLISALILLALLFVLNPELRLLLMFADAVGFDVLIVLLVLQFRGWFDVLYAIFRRMLRRGRLNSSDC